MALDPSGYQLSGAASTIASSSTAQAPGQAPPPPLVLLDVSLNAPVIVLPQSSSSSEALELDLGILRVTNSIAWDQSVVDPSSRCSAWL